MVRPIERTLEPDQRTCAPPIRQAGNNHLGVETLASTPEPGPEAAAPTAQVRVAD